MQKLSVRSKWISPINVKRTTARWIIQIGIPRETKVKESSVVCVHAFDQFAGGLGTAVLISFSMRACSERFKAAHFAIGTGLMNVSGVLAGVAIDFLA